LRRQHRGKEWDETEYKGEQPTGMPKEVGEHIRGILSYVEKRKYIHFFYGRHQGMSRTEGKSVPIQSHDEIVALNGACSSCVYLD
ncbi:MAG TPA: hypothetical protein VN223_13030, partial [Candidatus Elarobacter sp.]|nr:hypothetical protein [Candidatus Elarobacter sp.]